MFFSKHPVAGQYVTVWPLNFSQCFSHEPHTHVVWDVPLIFLIFMSRLS